jgi:hypothetical protein
MTVGETAPPRPAAAIAAVSLIECIHLERVEVDRLLWAVEALGPSQWETPVEGGVRTVSEIVAATAGTYAAQARIGQAWRQLDPRALQLFRFPGEPMRATIARTRAGQRFGRSPSSLIAEVRTASRLALHRRELVARWSVALAPVVPRPAPLVGWPRHPLTSLFALWRQRFEIAEATETPIVVSVEHDGRLIELVFRERFTLANAAIGGQTVDVRVEPLEVGWRFGPGADASATTTMTMPVVMKLLTGGRSAEGTRERSNVNGDVRLTTALLRTLHGAVRG